MSKKYEIKYLSKKFHLRYPNDKYPEFENKDNRPYAVFLIKIEDHTFAIPFRTNMNHKYGYRFKNSGRVSQVGTGLDFTKVIIVDDKSLLGEDATVDKKEFLELSDKYYFIRLKFVKYLEGYFKYLNNELNIYQAKAYRYSTLNYYKDILNRVN